MRRKLNYGNTGEVKQTDSKGRLSTWDIRISRSPLPTPSTLTYNRSLSTLYYLQYYKAFGILNWIVNFLLVHFSGQPTSTPFGFHTRPTGTPCSLQQYVCKNLRCVDKAQICNFKDDCGDNSDELPCGSNCTFEGDCYKGWRQSTGSSNFNWRRKNGKTPSVGTGPTNDHTVGNQNVCNIKLKSWQNFEKLILEWNFFRWKLQVTESLEV